MENGNNRTKPFRLPDQPEGFTINEIVVYASKMYQIKYDAFDKKGKNTFGSIRKKVERTIKDKKYKPISDPSVKKNRKYSREDVYKLLKYDLKPYSQGKVWRLWEQKNDPDENIELREKKKQLDALKKKEEERLEKEREAFIENEFEAHLSIQEEDLDPNFQPTESTELQIEEFRHKIFREYIFREVFNALIEFDEDEYRYDLNFINGWEDVPNPPDDVTNVKIKLSDDKNYYTPRFDLCAFLQKVIQEKLQADEAEGKKQEQNKKISK